MCNYFICTTPRTGSSLLCEALEFTRIAGVPREYFEAVYEKDWCARLGITSDHEYLEKLATAGMTANGVFGAKVHWHQLRHLLAKCVYFTGRQHPNSSSCDEHFPTSGTSSSRDETSSRRPFPIPKRSRQTSGTS